MTDTLDNLLEVALDTLGYASAEGLVRDGAAWLPDARSFVWRELQQKGGIEAAYFRGGVPLVAFAHADDRGGVARIHRRLWNLSRVPILVASTASDISAYSCYMVPTAELEIDRAILRTAEAAEDIPEVLAEFSRFHVESGTVASSYGDHFRRSDRVDKRLLDNLRSLRSSLPADPERRRALDGLIGRAIFVRYFEDRGILDSSHIRELTPFGSFLEVLEAGSAPTYQLFDALSDRFNGDVFDISGVERGLITDWDLSTIASFFGGTDVETGQRSFWPYDFSVIPPELISSIYEQLLEEDQRSDAAYYTPRSVVDLILDETLAWTESPESVRLLDPACGSGIFLTEAYRRLVFQLSLHDHTPLTFDDLCSLLVGSIFGIDQNSAAVSVAALGLYLALLEELDPPTAWRDARLPRLVGTNLLVRDFFSDHQFSTEKFDVVVGNPPWKSQLSLSAIDYLHRAGISVADRQIALAFAFRSIELLSDEGVLGLLLPAKALLHNKSRPAVETRLLLFEALTVESVLDLSILRRQTFHSAVAPAAVLVARKVVELDQREPSEILHVVPRGSPLQSSIDGFVVSQDDVHRVPTKLAAAAPDIWKVLLWGTMQDYELISRLRSSNKSLGEVAAERDWVHGRGFQIRGGDRNDASQLVGLPFVPTESVRAFHTVRDDYSAVASRIMHRPRDVNLYGAPHVLIRRGLLQGRPVAALVDQVATFNDAVIGVAAPSSDLDHLRLLTAYVNSSLGYYYQFMTSSSWGVERDYIEANEHLDLPFAQPRPRQTKRVLEAVAIAEASEFEESSWRRRLDEAVFDAYELDDEAVDRVKDALQTRLDQFERGAGSAAFGRPTDDEFTVYLSGLRRLLEASLESVRVEAWISNENEFYAVATVRLRDAREEVLVVGAPQRPIIDSLISVAEESVGQWPSPATILQPSVVLLRGEEAHLVKPNELRYWTVTNARDDAAAVVGAITRSV
jgi:hypothetical protein